MGRKLGGQTWVKNCKALPGIHRKSGRIFNRALVNLGEWSVALNLQTLPAMLCSSESALIMTASLHANTFSHVPVRYTILPLAKRPTFQKLKLWYRNPNSTHQHHLHNQLFTSRISFSFHVTHVYREERNHEWKCYLRFEVLHFIMPTSSPNVLWQCCLCHLERQVIWSWVKFQVFGNS